VLEILYHRAEFGGPRISNADTTTKNVVISLSVCLAAVTLLSEGFVNDEFCAHDSALCTETVLTPLDRGRFVVLQRRSTFSV